MLHMRMLDGSSEMFLRQARKLGDDSVNGLLVCADTAKWAPKKGDIMPSRK